MDEFIHAIDAFDKAIFIFLNGLHSPILDPVMVLFTQTNTWIPLYAVIIFFLVKQFRWQSIWILIAIALTITLCDQFASTIMKPLVGRLRPCHFADFSSFIHLPDGASGGKYGFISSHAANTFGLAAFLWYLLKTKINIAFLYGLWFWAFVVTYTRVYVGVHYPLDLIFGAISGVLWAYLVYHFIYLKIPVLKNLKAS